MTTTVDANNSSGFKVTADTSGILQLQTNGTAAVTIDTSQNVGVGTTPSYKLDVNSLSASNVIGRFTNNSGYYTYLLSSGATSVFSADTSGNNSFTIRGASNQLELYTNGSLRSTLDSSGNLGLGVTPSAWATTKGFQIGATTAVSDSGTGNSDFRCNSYYNAGDKYIGNGYSSMLRLVDGQFKFFNAGNNVSGAGATCTFTQAMTLDASGNLGIGQTSPAFKLDVQVAVGNAIAVRPSTSTGNAKQSALRLYGSESVTASRYAEVACFNDTAGSDTNALTFSTGFGTSIFERARISSDGNLLVGTTSASNRKAYFKGGVASTQCFTFDCDTAQNNYVTQFFISGQTPNNNTSRFLTCNDSTTDRAYIYSNGGIGNYSANNVNLSDRREKTNFAPATSYLDKICSIPVQTFNYIDQNLEEDGGLTLGVVAQDVQAVAPELVNERNWGTDEAPKMRLSIYQTDLQYALMKCIQEQQALIQSLTDRLTALEAK